MVVVVLLLLLPTSRCDPAASLFGRMLGDDPRFGGRFSSGKSVAGTAACAGTAAAVTWLLFTHVFTAPVTAVVTAMPTTTASGVFSTMMTTAAGIFSSPSKGPPSPSSDGKYGGTATMMMNTLFSGITRCFMPRGGGGEAAQTVRDRTSSSPEAWRLAILSAVAGVTVAGVEFCVGCDGGGDEGGGSSAGKSDKKGVKTSRDYKVPVVVVNDGSRRSSAVFYTTSSCLSAIVANDNLAIPVFSGAVMHLARGVFLGWT